MKFLLSSILLLFLVNISMSQSDSIQTNHANIEIIKDNRIDNLNKTYKSSFKLRGYRVQIYSGNKKQPAKDTRARFMRLYSNVKAHETYQQPYYKVKTGDFKTKLEALKFLKQINGEFPNSFIVRDEIEF